MKLTIIARGETGRFLRLLVIILLLKASRALNLDSANAAGAHLSEIKQRHQIEPSAGKHVADRGSSCDLTPVPIVPLFCGDKICESFLGEDCQGCPGDCGADPLITAVTISYGPFNPIPSHGDQWLSTWADDGTQGGKLYMAWGDGCGPGVNWAEDGCRMFDWDTDTCDLGVFEMTGTLPNLTCLHPDNRCERKWAVPDGIVGWPHMPHDNKAGSMLAIAGVLYLATYEPQREPTTGYIAASTDNGTTWTDGQGQPWMEESGESPRSYFRCLMFINMGKDYEFNTDGYIYALAIGWGWDWDVFGRGLVYLARVPVAMISVYAAYEYFAGLDGSSPRWSWHEADASPVPGLSTSAVGSAMYHAGINRYLFLSLTGLFEAANPWGPWIMAAPLLMWGEHPALRDATTSGLITKDAGPVSVYFTSSSIASTIGYDLNIFRMDFTLNPDLIRTPTHCLLKGQEGAAAPATLPLLSPTPTPIPSVTATITPTCTNFYFLAAPPGGSMTIQAALDGVCNHGVIRLGDGVYSGPGNINLDFRGKAITLESSHGPNAVTIDCERKGQAFVFTHGEGADTMVRGITIKNGFSFWNGGGISLIDSSPSFDDCIITQCTSWYHGGAVMGYNSQSIFTNCTFTNNFSGYPGGAIALMNLADIFLENCTVKNNGSYADGGGLSTEIAALNALNCAFSGNRANLGGGLDLVLPCRSRIENCFIESNYATTRGAGLYIYSAIWRLCPDFNVFIDNCTLRGNTVTTTTSDSYGGGLCLEISMITAIKDCIFWDNYAQNGPQIALVGWNQFYFQWSFGEVDISYSDFQGDLPDVYILNNFNFNWGPGMFAADPLFVPGLLGSSYLSQISAGQPTNSPCINTGSALAQNRCYERAQSGSYVCMSQYTNATNQQLDTGQVDRGAHYQPINPIPVMSASMTIIAIVFMTALLCICL